MTTRRLSLSFVVSRCHLLSLVVIRRHSLSPLVVTQYITRLSIYRRSKSMDFQFCKLAGLQRKIQRKAYKSKQIPVGKLSRLARTKFNFRM